MKILITGSGGFIGQALVKSLGPKYTIIALSSGLNSPIQGTSCDLTSLDKTRTFIRKFKDQRIDAIIHLASLLCTPKNQKQIKLLEDNQVITGNVIALAEAFKPKILVHSSSMAVYPNRDGLYKENGTVDPSVNADGLYGLSKFNAETLLNFFLSLQIKVIHLRITQVYGPGMRRDRIFPSMIRELKGKNTITVFGDGKRITNFVHVKDVAATIDKVLNKPQAGVYNVGCRRHWTLEQWAGKIIREYGNSRSKIIKVHRGSMVKQCIDTHLINKVFGIKNQTVDLKGIEINV